MLYIAVINHRNALQRFLGACFSCTFLFPISFGASHKKWIDQKCA